MTVNLSQALDFEVSPPIVDCLTGIRFEAILKNAAPTDVNFLWRDDLGIIVGRRQEFVPSRSGTYTLEVQPTSGGLCPTKNTLHGYAAAEPFVSAFGSKSFLCRANDHKY